MSLSSSLSYRVLVSGQVPVVTPAPLPDGHPQMAPPLASTLIYGDKDAILVDAPATVAAAVNLGKEIAREGKRLTQIYITHGHGDHWFGVTSLLARLPEAEVVATPGTMAVTGQLLRQRIGVRRRRWRPQHHALLTLPVRAHRRRELLHHRDVSPRPQTGRVVERTTRAGSANTFAEDDSIG